MNSNAPLERLIDAMMALDAQVESPDFAVESRCLLRKIEWAAAEAETAVRRCEESAAKKRANLSASLSAAA